jgi:hypothetical protein
MTPTRDTSHRCPAGSSAEVQIALPSRSAHQPAADSERAWLIVKIWIVGYANHGSVSTCILARRPVAAQKAVHLTNDFIAQGSSSAATSRPRRAGVGVVDRDHGVACTSISQELNSQRKKAFTVWVMVIASLPTLGDRKS